MVADRLGEVCRHPQMGVPHQALEVQVKITGTIEFLVFGETANADPISGLLYSAIVTTGE